ncbi:MAG TPA: hypothetical protein VFU02_09205 [Polyangiaceae bacterium]|nr:hypothetical protein [Polyangiaceae bacterium]
MGTTTPETGETTAPTPLEGQRNVGVLVTLGSYTGFGGGLQLGSPALGLRASAGWVPVLVSYQEAEEEPELKLYSGYQLAGDAYARALETRQGASIGVTTGYRYHSLLGSGVALGGYGTFRINAALDGFVQGGLVWFFSGEDRLRKEKADDIPEGVEFGWPGPSINYLISIGIILFP